MGKQVGFFAVLEDMADLFVHIKDRGDLILSTKGERMPGLNKILEAKICSEMGLHVFLSRDGFRIEKFRGGYLDIFKSEVVELLSGSYYKDKKQLEPGRFYVDMYDLKNGKYYRKNEELDKVYESYKKYIVKMFRKSVDRRRLYYIGPKAYELFKNGWHMVLGPKVEIYF